MTESLRIVVADDEERTRDYLSQAVQRLGHVVVGLAATGDELIRLCRHERPDLLIADVKMPDVDGIDAAAAAYAEAPVAIILVSAFHDEDLIERASRESVLSYLVKPVRDTDLQPAITLARQRFCEFQALRQEAADARQALEDRKLIERAKGIVMQGTGLSEPEAFRRLQKMASHKSVKLAEIARMLITADETMQLKEL